MTTPQFWLGLAFGVPLVALALALLSRHRREPDPRPSARGEHEPLPPTLLQARARWGLLIGGLTAAAALVVVLIGDPGAFMRDAGQRELVYGVFALGVLAYGAMALLTRRSHRGEVQLDERDREILARAPRVQAGAILFTLLAWAVALTEHYWDHGQVPISFPFLMFLSCCLVSLMAFSAGILIGYRRT